jgi:hypothetical protein
MVIISEVQEKLTSHSIPPPPAMEAWNYGLSSDEEFADVSTLPLPLPLHN